MLDLCAKCRNLVEFHARKIVKSGSMQENEKENYLQEKQRMQNLMWLSRCQRQFWNAKTFNASFFSFFHIDNVII